MNSIILKNSFLVCFYLLFAIASSCSKSHTSSKVPVRTDTVKYEAILNDYTNDWCVTMIAPGDYKSIDGVPPGIPPTGDGNYYFGECNETHNQIFTFTVDKYANKSIPLTITAYNQWYGVPAYADTAVTLNIYINDSIVATQTSRIKDSVHYTIN